MGIPTNAYSTFNALSFGYANASAAINHEDLVDVVTILDSYQTPFFSASPKIRARDVVHSWTYDTLTGVDALTAGAVEGNDFAESALTSPKRLINVTQIFSRSVTVSDRERDANPAGIRDMYEHQVMKEFKNLARGFETMSWSPAGSASATGAAATPPQMKGFFGYASPTASASNGTVSTADIIKMSQTLFNEGAEPDSLWFSPAGKSKFISATVNNGLNVRNIAATDQRLVANIDVFETPFNQLYAVIVDRFITDSTGSADKRGYWIGDRSMAKVAFFRPPQHKPMGKSGDHTRGLVLMETTIEITHPSAWGLVAIGSAISG